MTSARYTPPTVTVTPVPDDWKPGNRIAGVPQFNSRGGHQRPDLWVVLDVRTGALTAHSSLASFDRHQARTSSAEASGWSGYGWYDPETDLWLAGWGFDRTPERLAWVHNSAKWVTTAEGVNARLARIRPYAQQLVEALDSIPGTDGDYDWTVPATTLHAAIDELVRAQHDDPRDPPVTAARDWIGRRTPISFEQLIEADPDVIDPSWATMTDAQLDEVAAGVTRRSIIGWAGTVGGRVCARFDLGGWTNGEPPKEPYVRASFQVVNARAGLRQWRDTALAMATSLPTVYAGEMFPDGYDAEELTASSADATIDWLAALIDATAAQRDKVALTGTREMLLKQRAEMRARVRREAQAAGERAARLKREYQAARAAADGYLWQVIGFGEEPEYNPDGTLSYAELGRLGSMTRVAAGQKFKPAEVEETDVPKEAAV